jgi:hypothetical protein
MSILPTDLPSFAWGALLGVAAAFATGFFKKAGEHAFAYIANKIHPKAPEPVQVDGRFVPTRFAASECAWINEVKLYEYEEKGYTYYPHPKSDAPCFRMSSDGMRPLKEFLLVQPGARELTNA